MVALLFSHVDHISAETEMEGEGNETGECTGSYYCKKGVILPIWEPQDPSFGDKIARATVYFVAMVYMFLGVSIIADRFMSSIEVITSQEKEITIKKPNGETTKTTVRIWNETVSNLTLMALGSSAPEILLSVIEVCGHNFTAGDLGPSTIVGSAAFNMFIIIALCVYVVPDGETRKIKHLRVFFVTAAWSIFAYTWLYIILSVSSPGVVEVWEGLLTFFFFPICVVFAWVADRRLLFYKYVYKRYRAGKQRGMIIEHEGDRPSSKTEIEMDGKVVNSHVDSFLDGALVLEVDERDQDDEEARREMARILKELKQKHPEKEIEQLIELANYQVLSQQQKSRAFYRIQATRLMTGAGNILKRHAADQARKAVSMHEVNTEVAENDPVSKIFFEQGTYQCLENCGTVALTIIRRGGDLTNTVFVDFRTEDGTANAGSDYEFTEGTVVFKPGETQKEIRVGIIDDDIFEEDENFLVHLSNVKVSLEASEDGILEASHVSTLACLGSPSTATVTIFDDDHAGIFTFEEPVTHVSESIGIMEVKVLRTSGARGNVIVPYKTIEGTARGGGEDFEDTCGELEFQNDEIVFVNLKLFGGGFKFISGQQLALDSFEAGVLDREPKTPLSFGSKAVIALANIHSFKNVLSKMSKVSGSNIFLLFKPLPISMMLKGNAWPGVPPPPVENNNKYVSETDDGFLPGDISGPRINVLFTLNEFHRLFGIHVAMILQLSEHHDFLDLQGGVLMNHHTVWP
ncbi:hypothetical protein MG293_003515 [Ovis ammon polii]|uniref:Sodium/calcium exchanger 1 n=1 Tax=Ovis ammon polii TaxID=230172 RepID=A0AAD4UMW0_OVIAM|nr:hypothetical protein MG293_003515 [Ovis ammon polii]